MIVVLKALRYALVLYNNVCNVLIFYFIFIFRCTTMRYIRFALCVLKNGSFEFINFQGKAPI